MRVPWYFKATKRNGQRRCRDHNYYGRGLYMITVNKAPRVPAFSKVVRKPDGRVFVQLFATGRRVQAVLKNIADIGRINTPRVADGTNTPRIADGTGTPDTAGGVGTPGTAGGVGTHDVGPCIKVYDYIIMPDHVHFVLHVTRDNDRHLGDWVREIKRQCTLQLRELFRTKNGTPTLKQDNTGLAHTPASKQDNTGLAQSPASQQDNTGLAHTPASQQDNTGLAQSPTLKQENTGLAHTPTLKKDNTGLAQSPALKQDSTGLAQSPALKQDSTGLDQTQASQQENNSLAHPQASQISNHGVVIGPAFTEGYNDLIINRGGVLERLRDYIYDNPRRRLWREEHPDYLRRIFRAVVQVDKPDGVGGYVKEAVPVSMMGNVFLLRAPDIRQVRVSRRIDAGFLDDLVQDWAFMACHGCVAVSPFVSAGEKAIRDAAVEAGGSLIVV